MPSTKADNAAISKTQTVLQIFGGHNPYPNIPKICFKAWTYRPSRNLHDISASQITNRSLDVVRPSCISITFGSLKPIKPFSSYVGAKSVGCSVTPKLALLQALSLTIAPWLCHRKVHRGSGNMLPQNTCIQIQNAHRFGATNRNMLCAIHSQ